MASIATVVTMGYGSFGSVNLIPTLGYGIGAAASVVSGPFRMVAGQIYQPGLQAGQIYQPGLQTGQING